MKHILLLLTGLLLSCSTVFSPSKAKLYRSVARVEYPVEDGTLLGTAFAISNNILITAGHVCSSITEDSLAKNVSPEMKIFFLDKENKPQRTTGRVIAINEEDDLCLLLAADHDMIPLRIESEAFSNRLDKVFLIGAPEGHFPTMTECFIGSFTGEEELDPELAPGQIATSCNAIGGYSGSPLVTERGTVVGVMVEILYPSPFPQTGYLDYSTPSSKLLEFLKNNGIID